MGRPKKELRIEKNGESLKVYDRMGYAGSISLAELSLFVRKKGLHPGEVFKETVVLDEKTQ